MLFSFSRVTAYTPSRRPPRPECDVAVAFYHKSLCGVSMQLRLATAADAEGHWLPEDGYTWVVNPPIAGDFRVKLKSFGP